MHYSETIDCCCPPAVGIRAPHLKHVDGFSLSLSFFLFSLFNEESLLQPRPLAKSGAPTATARPISRAARDAKAQLALRSRWAANHRKRGQPFLQTRMLLASATLHL